MVFMPPVGKSFQSQKKFQNFLFVTPSFITTSHQILTLDILRGVEESSKIVLKAGESIHMIEKSHKVKNFTPWQC
jgi:hypothetical protein